MSSSTRLSAQEASQRLAEGWTFLDVRTTEEFEAGHPPGAFNVPIALSAPGGMAPNPDFVRVVAAAFPKDARLVLGCKGGVRSLRAATALVEAGFTSVTDMRPGWDGARDAFGQLTEPGWSRHELPVEQGRPEGRSWSDMQRRSGA